MSDDDKYNIKSNIWSYIALALVSGFIGIIILFPIGFFITMVLKRPKTTFDIYGWRGFGTVLAMSGIGMIIASALFISDFIFYNASALNLLLLPIALALLYAGKKLIMNWT